MCEREAVAFAARPDRTMRAVRPFAERCIAGVEWYWDSAATRPPTLTYYGEAGTTGLTVTREAIIELDLEIWRGPDVADTGADVPRGAAVASNLYWFGVNVTGLVDGYVG